MANSFASFDKRLGKINRKNRKLARGYRNTLVANGTIQPQPVPHVYVPVKGILLLIAGCFVFKAFMFASVGPVSYGDRVDLLAQGTQVERVGAWLMQVDPVTGFLAEKMGPLLR